MASEVKLGTFFFSTFLRGQEASVDSPRDPKVRLYDSEASGSTAAGKDSRDRFNLRAIKPKNSSSLLLLYCGCTALFKVNLFSNYTASAAMVTFAFLHILPSADGQTKSVCAGPASKSLVSLRL